MIKPHFIIICEKAFLTSGSNNLNLIGIFSQINAASMPVTWPSFALVVNFDSDGAGQVLLRTDIMDPTGKQVAHTELPVALTAGNMQVIANFEHMRFVLSGAYAINVSIDGQPVGQRILTVAPVLAPTSRKANIA